LSGPIGEHIPLPTSQRILGTPSEQWVRPRLVISQFLAVAGPKLSYVAVQPREGLNPNPASERTVDTELSQVAFDPGGR